MKPENSRLNAIVADSLASLRETFPLQHRIEDAPVQVQTAYARILNHWRVRGSAPPANIVDATACATLVDMDAVVVQGKGLGCYPFSADDRGFTVNCAGDGEYVNAFCAIDALAIPLLLGRRARIESSCAFCDSALHVEVNADGTLPEQCDKHILVVWRPGDQTGSHEACCNRMCPNIQFACASCASSSEAATLTLPQAAAIGNSFFSFQQCVVHPHIFDKQ